MQKILVAGPAWVGDMVMAQSLYKTLRQRYPDVVIDVLAPAWSGPILKRMPEVRRHIEMPLGHGALGLKQRYRLGKSLRAERYDQAIITPRSFKSALTPYFAQIPLRTGYKGELRYGLINDMRPLDKMVLTQTVQRYVALGLERDAALPPEIIYPSLTVDAENQQRLLQSLNLSLQQPVVGFMPAAEYGPSKRWPPEYFAQLAQQLVVQGRQVWLFGSAKDKPLCDEIAAAAGVGVTNLAGRTQLEDAVDLIALTDLVVSNDSGLMHIAAATGGRIIALYGSSSPDYTPPLTDNATVLYLRLECSPCFERECPLGHYRCLKEISPQKVFEICQQ
ncbi:MAG: lipopolysaccharide heptosyltransferase II [Pseudomonadota bacterium]|nr:lipopolysaccharide heptosyltransferase II [Pseudomonadota bacterium]